MFGFLANQFLSHFVKFKIAIVAPVQSGFGVLGDTVLNLVVASGYLSRLIGNPRLSGYLERHHPEILTEFRAIVAATSLEESGSGASEEPAFLG